MELTAQQKILSEITDERTKQDNKHGVAIERGYTLTKWNAVLTEETGEAAREVNQVDEVYTDHHKLDHVRKLRAELIQSAAVCVAWIESLDTHELNPNKPIDAAPPVTPTEEVTNISVVLPFLDRLYNRAMKIADENLVVDNRRATKWAGIAKHANPLKNAIIAALHYDQEKNKKPSPCDRCEAEEMNCSGVDKFKHTCGHRID